MRLHDAVIPLVVLFIPTVAPAQPAPQQAAEQRQPSSVDQRAAEAQVAQERRRFERDKGPQAQSKAEADRQVEALRERVRKHPPTPQEVQAAAVRDNAGAKKGEAAAKAAKQRRKETPEDCRRRRGAQDPLCNL